SDTLIDNNYNRSVINSERSEECIDFTMTITSRNNAPISNYGGGFRCKILEVTFSNSFQKNREKQKKNDGKTGIFTQNTFSTKSNFFYGCNSKTNHCKYMKFSPNYKFLRNLSKTRKFAKLKFWCIQAIKNNPPFSPTTEYYILG
ncbi:Uncharacterized protein FWK35_00008837, partial [Aphis craccivora]